MTEPLVQREHRGWPLPGERYAVAADSSRCPLASRTRATVRCNAGDNVCMDPIATTQHWLERAVIGLNLCPFAKAVHQKQQIRWVECPARDAQGVLEDLTRELRLLVTADPDSVDTTLLIHPHALNDFLEYNDFLDVVDSLLEALGLTGVVQVASFHPDYRFAGTASDDPANLSNRSPYPMLHLLREESIARAVAAMPDTATIPERNIENLRRLGAAGWREHLARND